MDDVYGGIHINVDIDGIDINGIIWINNTNPDHWNFNNCCRADIMEDDKIRN